MYIIYKHTNSITKKAYIGLTKHSITHRFNQHKVDAFRHRKGELPTSAFYRAMRKYGTECWESEILEENLSYEEANTREQYFISYFNTYSKGYNSTIGGDHQFPASIKVTGIDHHSSDTTTYTFYNINCTTFIGDKFTFLKDIFGSITRTSRTSINKVIQGKANSYKGWYTDYTKILDIKRKQLQAYKKALTKMYSNVEATKPGKEKTPLDLLILKTKTLNKPTRPKRGSKEWLENCRKNSTGSKNAMWGTTRPQHVKDAVSKRRRSEADQTLRDWINITTGIIEYSIKSIDLRDKYQLNISHLKKITDKKQKYHKGWTLYVEKS